MRRSVGMIFELVNAYPFVSAVDPDDEVGRRKILVMSVIIALTIVGNGYILISIICKARQ